MTILTLLAAIFCMRQTSDTALLHEVDQYLDRWDAAMVAADTAALSAMMDDAIILRHISGATQSKREWLDDVQRGTMRYHNIEKHDVKIKAEKDGSVIVRFTSVITATIYGGRGTWTLHPTMRLLKRNGDWIRIE